MAVLASVALWRGVDLILGRWVVVIGADADSVRCGQMVSLCDVCKKPTDVVGCA